MNGSVLTLIPSAFITNGKITGHETNALSIRRITLGDAGLTKDKSGGKLVECMPNIRSFYCAAIVAGKRGLLLGQVLKGEPYEFRLILIGKQQ